MIKKISGYLVFLSKKLGSGSYGVVYKGQQQGTKIPVAVKVLNKSSINSDPYLKAALISEIRIMKVLRNENIVQLFDVMESNNNYYIIQQLCDMDLQKYMSSKPGRKLPEQQAIRILRQICNGFLLLVKQGILHRDLKPANIFINKNHVKIGDFGFAKKSAQGLKNHTCVGTPLYMPVELLKGLPYTSKCDIWAIGFIFFEILHGDTPWTASSEYQLIRNIQTKPLIIDKSLSQTTKDFLQRTLKVNEESRISWDELFAHPIFNGFFNNELKNGGNQLQNKYKKVMIDIRFQVNSQNIHLKKLWQSLGYSDYSQLNQQQFIKFLKSIVPNIDDIEAQYFFSKMDANKNGRLSLQQIQKQFLKYEIPLTSKFEDRIPFLLRKMVSFEDDDGNNTGDQGIDPSLEKKVRMCFKKLEAIINKKKINLYQVFQAYDGDRSGQLTIDQFTRVINKLDSTFTQEEINCIFDLVDVDKSKTIEFQELNAYYSRINCIPESLNLPPEYFNMKKNIEKKEGKGWFQKFWG